MNKIPLAPSPNIWKDLGQTVVKWVDSSFLYGVGGLSKDVLAIVLRAARQSKPPLDWAYPWTKLYTNQDSLFWVRDQDGEILYLPQVIVIGPTEFASESSIKIELLGYENFRPHTPVDAGWEFYRRTADGSLKKMFFDDENARLTAWDPLKRTLSFQGCFYFDYLKTNLALDAPLPVFGTLREQLAKDGRIEELALSKLANTTGINGLLFSDDGYMIFQARRPTVLIRPYELCPGFSGTIDKIDIVNAVAGDGTLDKLDAPREMVEEIGIHRQEIKNRRFLGLTRELIRGGAPEMFYALDIGLSANAILARIPRDREGFIKKIFFGQFASAQLNEPEAEQLPEYFWSLVRQTQAEGKKPISVPFLTNLALWYQAACSTCAGASVFPKEQVG
jgi:hypothetical protein